ncbi:esterase-like activity of phytase family protein [Neorhizobium alkalisoli]|uniref:Phytase-like domain-containing protein n=1 Tax=Neorhizobium alkalisoli TaxID=528178 RepID=A0A561QW10_9HYPH|nr:esterase-like activity of phytase family protein [Neorhizobium alkalisoli]TWF54516.1 hypothetical protein FHW37_103384 [Neorhizobium alkalisoli]
MRLPLVILSLFLSSSVSVLAQEFKAPTFVDEVTLPTAFSMNGVRFGGISDLSYDAAAGNYLAIADDRAENGPVRFYRIAVKADKGKIATLDILGMQELLAPGGAHFPLKGADPEGIALDGANKRIFWSSERNEKNVPMLYVADQDGTNAKSITLPDAYIPNADGSKGVLTNLGFEGLDLSADGATLYAMNENGLAQDGGKATIAQESASRLMLLDTQTLAPKAQYIYLTDKIPVAPEKADGWADNGVSAVHAMKDGRLIVVERNFTDGHGFNIRFYIADATGATDVSGMEKVSAAEIKPMAKTPWFSLKDGDNGLKIDNIESIAFGPMLDGKQTMLLASDNNFSPDQASKFTLFTVDIPALH